MAGLQAMVDKVPLAESEVEAEPSTNVQEAVDDWQQAETELLEELRLNTERMLQEQELIATRFIKRVKRTMLDAPPVGEANPGSAGTGGTTHRKWSPRSNTLQMPVSTAGANTSELVTADSSMTTETGASFKKRILHEPTMSLEESGPAASKLAILHQSYTSWREETDKDPWVLAFIKRWHTWWTNRKEPARTGWLPRLVLSYRFELMTLFMIVANGVFIVYETDDCAHKAQDALVGTKPEDCRTTWLVVADLVFAVYFLVEVLLRLWVHKIYFFCNEDTWWNIFDFTVIAFTWVDIIMYFVGSAAGGQTDVIFLRILRLFRMTRSLRFLRALHFVRVLRQLVECMVASLTGVIWCMVLLVFITGIAATFLVQCTTNRWMDPGFQMNEGDKELDAAFGTVMAAMFTLFQATSGGDDWGNPYRILRVTGEFGPAIYILYILFFIIAAWNIVTSLFIEKALALAQPDLDTQMLNRRRQDLVDAKELLSLIQKCDTDHSGTLSMEEFKDMMSHQQFRTFFEIRNIDIKDAEVFFAMLQSAVGRVEIEVDTLVHGIIKMRGVASSLDLQGMQFQINDHYMNTKKGLRTLQKEIHGLSVEIRSVSDRVYLGSHDSGPHNGEIEEVRVRGQRSAAMQLVQNDIECLSLSPAESPFDTRSRYNV